MIVSGKNRREITLPEGYRLSLLSSTEQMDLNEVFVGSVCMGVLVTPTKGGSEIFYSNATSPNVAPTSIL